MVFLKIIVSIAIAAVLLVFLNNLFARFSPVSTDYSDGYSKCQHLSPYKDIQVSTSENIIDRTMQDQYDKCIREKQQESNDQYALQNLYAWIKGIVVLLVLVSVAVLLFKKYPFFSSALIGCGLLFLLSYPTFSRYGGLDFLYGSGGDLSASVRNQVAIFKLLASLIGFLALSVADVFFFERHHVDQPPQINQVN